MRVKINLPNGIKIAEVTHDERIPVRDFPSDQIVSYASIIRDGDQLYADFEVIVNTPIKLEYVDSVIKPQDESHFTPWKIVQITMQQPASKPAPIVSSSLESLTKENFWNDLFKKYPTATKIFCQWIDKYKESINWVLLFGQGERTADMAPKFHQIPIAMQVGILLQFSAENGKFYSELELSSWHGPKGWRMVITDFFRTANVDDGAVSLQNSPIKTKTEYTYKIGTSHMYGNLVVAGSDLSEFEEEIFYKEIDNALERFKLQEHKKDAYKISNLKKGVTIGDMFFKIYKKKQEMMDSDG